MSETTSVRFSVTMPKSYSDALDKLAVQELSSRNREILVAVRAHIDAHKRGKK